MAEANGEMGGCVISRRVVRVFVSSPGDVADERAQLAAVVQELNTTPRSSGAGSADHG
jgi:hypothetical protein